MRKGVAIHYIIMLILGVGVIGLVGFWFSNTGGKFGGQNIKTICDNKFLQWCITRTGESTYSQFQAEVSDCQAVVGSYTQCSDITIGIGGNGGSSRSGGNGEDSERVCNIGISNPPGCQGDLNLCPGEPCDCIQECASNFCVNNVCTEPSIT